MPVKPSIVLFEPPSSILKRVRCSHCGQLTTVFCDPDGGCLAVDDDGALHIVRCAITRDDVQRVLNDLRESGTAYDVLLLNPARRLVDNENLI